MSSGSYGEMPDIPFPSELDVLRDVAQRLDAAGVAWMLTGSLALSLYAVPRMTRDIDIVIEIDESDVDRIASTFEPDYYVERKNIEEAIELRSSFNLIHRASVIKVDCIPRKPDEYHVTEFERRRQLELGDFVVPVVSREDLILSKLLWARESRSDVQLRDVRSLVDDALDVAYVAGWARRLEVGELWEEVSG